MAEYYQGDFPPPAILSQLKEIDPQLLTLVMDTYQKQVDSRISHDEVRTKVWADWVPDESRRAFIIRLIALLGAIGLTTLLVVLGYFLINSGDKISGYSSLATGLLTILTYLVKAAMKPASAPEPPAKPPAKDAA